MPALAQGDEMRIKRHGCAGVTLIELLVVVLVVAALMVLATPAFLSVVNSIRLTTAVNSLFSALHLARSEAAKRNARVVVCKSAMGDACTATGGWDQGWIVFHDANNNAALDAGEALLAREQALPQPIRFTGNNNVVRYVSYTAIGTAQPGTLTVCQLSATSVDARQIVISNSGRPRTVKTTVAQCL